MHWSWIVFGGLAIVVLFLVIYWEEKAKKEEREAHHARVRELDRLLEVDMRDWDENSYH